MQSYFGELSDLLDLLPKGRQAQSGINFNFNILESLLKFQGKDVIMTAFDKGYLKNNIPIESQSITGNQRLILELMNLEMPAAELTLSRAPIVDRDLNKIWKTQKDIADAHYDLYRESYFDKAWELELPTAPLATEDEVICFVYQFQKFELSEDSIPSINVVRRLNLRYSALVYALASLVGYDVFNLVETQRLIMSSIVSRLCSAAVLRVRSELDNPQIEDQIGEVLTRASEEIDDLLEHRNDYLF